jgi:uncharacterized protein (DUF427 family)
VPEHRDRAANGLEFESVRDYPRPPRIEPCARRVRVELAGRTVAESDRALRVLETFGAPTIYVPPEDVATELLRPAGGKTVCEFKGTASYLDVVTERAEAKRAAWTYRRPRAGYERLADHVAFYPARLDCTLDGEPVEPQQGSFYGGWVTAEIVGPIKGEPGTEGW